LNNGKKILIITYYWPPSGGPAVQRWLSLSDELANLGWEVFVLTVREDYATYQLYDTSHTTRVNDKIKVTRTKTREPFGLYKKLFGKKSIPAPGFANESNPSLVKKFARFIRGNLFIPDPRKGWKPYIIEAATTLIKAHDIRHVLTAGPPHSTHLAGAALKKKFSTVEWTCDFHDLWTDVIYYDLLYHLPGVKKKDAALERKILEDADHLLTVGEKYKQKLLSKSAAIKPSKFLICRIGYDEHYFADQVLAPQQQFVITYTGTIADYYQPEVFFKALMQVAQRHTDTPVLFKMVGILAGNIKDLIKKLGIEHLLQETGYVAHADAIAATRSSSVLLLLNPVTKDEEMVIPGKIYEYLAARKPIINITKLQSETAALIASCNAGHTFERTEQAELENYLDELIKKWKQTRNIDLPANTVIDIYSRKKIAGNLSAFLTGK
jgi:glycosyltransferase involved in cell wall biosynthesis